MKRVLAILLALAMVFSLAACGDKGTGTNGTTPSGTTSTEGSTQEEMVLRKLYDTEVNTLNYLITGEAWPQEVAANVIDTLTENDEKGNIIPGMAESWEISDDGTVYTFHLREGQYWYDYQGNQIAEVTAQDWVDALKYVMTSEYDSKVAEQAYCVLNAEDYYNKVITDFDEVGVKALDKYTLQYTLRTAVPYFLSALNYGAYMPAYGPLLEETLDQFGVDNTKLYYCGAFILESFQPQVEHIYVKNYNNWDADRCYITRIERTYNAEAATLAPTMILREEIDTAELSMDIIDDWKTNHAEYVSKERDDNMWCYFFCFDYRPCYDESWGPENWALAVMNSNFRHSIMSAYDAAYCVGGAYAPDGPESILQKTCTPAKFAYNNDGVDFTELAPFQDNDKYFYNEKTALEYKEKAVKELSAIGVTFPVTVVLTYKSGDVDWENFYLLFKQQVERVLGTDYINCVLNAGPSENFLSSTRRSGQYSLQLCNWGADYVDPETWTDPWGNNIDVESGRQQGSSYDRAALVTAPDDYRYFYENDGTNTSVIAKLDQIISSPYFAEFGEIYTEYMAAMDAAKEEGVDINKRYDLFAAAEDYLIENAFIIPSHVSAAAYQVVNYNIFEGQWAPSGLASKKYKWIKLLDHYVDMEEFQANYDAWLE